MLRRLTVTLMAVALSGTAASAQLVRPVRPNGPPQNVTTGVATVSSVMGQSVIHGTAVDTNASPLPNVSVRLRNLVTSEIEKTSTTNQHGEFTFFVQPDIPYVVEVADRAGRIIAVGNVVTAQAGGVAAAVVLVPLRLPALAGVFGNTAGAVVSSATGTGFTAIAADLRPPVSPDR